MYVYKTLNSKLYPAISELSSIFKPADIDNWESRDVRPLMSVLMRIAAASPRISGHILTRRTGIRSYSWQITASDKGDVDKAQQAGGRLNTMLTQIIHSYLDSVLYGVMAFQIGWDNDTVMGNKPMILKQFLPVELDYDGDKIIAVDENNAKRRIDEPGNEYVFKINQSFQRGGLLRSVIYHELLANETLMEWSNLNKRMKGIVAGILDAEKLRMAQSTMNLSDTEISNAITALDDSLKNIGDNNYLRTHSFAEIKFNSLVEASAGASFKAFKEALDNDITIAILGQANTSQLPSQGGSRAALQVMNLIRQDILWSDLLNVKELCDKALAMDYQMNYNSNDEQAPWSFEWIFDDNSDVEVYARVFESLARIGTIEVARGEFYQKLGLTMPATGDDVLTIKVTDTGLML